jgi:glycerol-3-phosphate acyltransferase PlsY
VLFGIIVSLGFVLIAYLLGSTPTGYIAGRILMGIDIRQYGSGGTGATNVLRTVGKKPALAVLLIDIGKGALAVLVVRLGFHWLLNSAWSTQVDWISWQPWIITLAGLTAILGHSRSIWINFTGGKSVATGLGVIFMMAWMVGLGALITFAVVLGIWRIVSLGSIAAAIATVALMAVTAQPLPYLLLAIAAGLYVILRHQTNIQRILAGKEPKIGQQIVQG